MTFCFKQYMQADAVVSLPPDPTPVVMVPGWGFDGRVVSLLSGRQVWWAPSSLVAPALVSKALDRLLEAHNWPAITLVGWSMGANLALDWAAANGDRVQSLYLLAMRKKWPKADIAAIRDGIRGERRQFMTSFYRKCFLGRKADYRNFTATLQDQYLSALDSAILEQGLDYLQEHDPREVIERAGVDCLPDRIMVVHGGKDIVAPAADRLRHDLVRQVFFEHEGHAVLGTPFWQAESGI